MKPAMRMYLRISIYVMLVCLVAQSPALAEPPPWRPPNASAIAKQLASPDAAAVKAAMAEVHIELEHDVGRGVSDIRGPYVSALMNAKHYAEADELALAAIVAWPQDLGLDQQMLNIRIQAMLALGKPDQALQDAKSLYNVSSMQDMPAAMLMVAQCLNANHPKDLSWAERFRQEQVAGAIFNGHIVVQANGDPNRPPELERAPVIHPTTQPNVGGPPLLASIHVDDSAYSNAVEHSFGEDYPALCGRGNLLLMADRTAEARVVFGRAYAVGAQQNLADASSNIARCMKAEDGSIGRANEWILSIRPDHRRREKE
jgi:hypothetical protein